MNTLEGTVGPERRKDACVKEGTTTADSIPADEFTPVYATNPQFLNIRALLWYMFMSDLKAIVVRNALDGGPVASGGLLHVLAIQVASHSWGI